MRNRFAVFSGILTMLSIGGCMNHPKIVEAKDVQFSDVREVESQGTRALRLEGLVFHSALAVEGVDISQSEGVARVMVKLTPAKSGLSGRFVVDVPLPRHDTRVLFGPSEVQIWPPTR